MIRRTLTSAAVLLAAGGLPAQDRGADQAKAAFEVIEAAFERARGEATAKRQAIAATDEYRKAREARDTEKIQELMAGVAFDMALFVTQFQSGAERFAGTEGAVPFLAWLANRSGDADATKAAIATLVEGHADSAALLGIVERPMWAYRGLTPDEAIETLSRIADASPHAMVRAYALYNAAQLTTRSKRGDEAAAKQAEDMLAVAEKLAAGTDLEAKIQAPRFQRQNLQIGMQVPDIEGEDLDGVPFKLSDYRGKVVVLDFWGDW